MDRKLKLLRINRKLLSYRISFRRYFHPRIFLEGALFLIFAMEVSVVKKVLSLLTFLSVFSLCTLASAYYIPREEIALGGIFVGASPEYVKSVYGEPTQSESGYDTMVCVW